MIFINLDEVFIDRVGHAAQVFGYELPKGVAFGLDQLRTSIRMSPIEFDSLLDAHKPSWEQSNGQPWIWPLLDVFDRAVLDYRLVGEFQRDADVHRYMDWTLKKLGHHGTRRLVLHSDQYPVPMRPGDTLVAASERKGKQWERRNGRFIHWQPYVPGHLQYSSQWQEVRSQVHGQPA